MAVVFMTVTQVPLVCCVHKFCESQFLLYISYTKGVLCGQCTNGTGMTVLLDKCDQCSSTYSILIGAVGM